MDHIHVQHGGLNHRRISLIDPKSIDPHVRIAELLRQQYGICDCAAQGFASIGKGTGRFQIIKCASRRFDFWQRSPLI